MLGSILVSEQGAHTSYALSLNLNTIATTVRLLYMHNLLRVPSEALFDLGGTNPTGNSRR